MSLCGTVLTGRDGREREPELDELSPLLNKSVGEETNRVSHPGSYTSCEWPTDLIAPFTVADLTKDLL